MPLLKTTPADYHFYAYDYAPGPVAFMPSQPQAGRNNMVFYSMEADLGGLLLAGQANHVPNIALNSVGQVRDQDNTMRDIRVLSFGGAAGNPANDPGVLLTGGIHAREWVAPAITYLIAEYLIKNYSANPVGPYQTALSNLIDSRRIYVIPLLNPNGNNYTVFSADHDARDWRKNRRLLPSNTNDWITALTLPVSNQPNPPFRNVNPPLPNVLNPHTNVSYESPVYKSNPTTYDTNTITPANNVTGVDLNRNYATPAWGHEQGSGLPSDITYFGPASASEFETRHLQNYMANLAALVPTAFETAIDYHSYTQAILYPTETFDSNLVTQNYSNLGLILQRLIATSMTWSFVYNYSLGSAMEIIGYDAMGDITDHEAITHHARTFTIELDPSSDNPGFELPENQIMGVFEKNIRAALALIAAAGQLSVATQGGWFERHTITSANELQFLTWDVFGRGNRLPV